MRLTEAGRLLHAHALRIVEAVRARTPGWRRWTQQVKRLRIAACPLAAAAVVPRALRLLRRRLPGAELVLEEATAAATRAARGPHRRRRVGVARAAPTIRRSSRSCCTRAAAGRAARRPSADPARHLDAEALAATPRICGDAAGGSTASNAARARRGRRGLRARAGPGGRAAAGRRRAARARRRRGVGAARGPAGDDVPLSARWPRSRRCARPPPVSVAHRANSNADRARLTAAAFDVRGASHVELAPGLQPRAGGRRQRAALADRHAGAVAVRLGAVGRRELDRDRARAPGS